MQIDEKRPAESFVRLYDDILENAKLLNAGVAAFGLYCAALSYAHARDTDGFIPRARLHNLVDFTGQPMNAAQVTQQLVELGKLEVVDDGFVVHDYLRHQQSHELREEFRESYRQRRSNGGKIRAASAARVGGRFAQTDLSDQPPTSSAPASDQLKEKGETETQDETLLPPDGAKRVQPLAVQNSADETKQRIDEVSRCWAEAHGWPLGKWPRARRYDAILIREWVAKLNAPLNFWEEVIQHACRFDPDVHFTWLVTGPNAQRVGLLLDRYTQWREREYERSKQTQPRESTHIANVLQRALVAESA
jgi:hypothetical protein